MFLPLQGYRPCAERASILFFVLNDIGGIDPMYQFALDSYIDLFNLSIDKAQRTSKLEERIQNMNEYHTYAVYRWMLSSLLGSWTFKMFGVMWNMDPINTISLAKH